LQACAEHTRHSGSAQRVSKRKRFTRIGNSAAIIVDRAVLEALGFDRETEIELRVVGTALVVRPVE
jgi:antitoxin component of MazEF toxin-antitoxin module